MNLNPKQEDMTASPSKYPQGYFKDKPCKRCGTVFKPQAPSHMHCSQLCADESIADKGLLRSYGITLNKYWEMLEEQDSKCAICREEGFTMAGYHWKKLVVDHCHTSGKVRGLLCHNCNRGLGLFQESSVNLEEAAKYVAKNQIDNQ